MSKTAKNLYLDPEIVRRAEEYGRRRGTNLSRLVSDYLEALTRRNAGSSHGPLVQRLIGAGAPRPSKGRGRQKAGVPDYRKHLEDKYGRS